MEDFQGKYNGKQIEQLLDKANDIDLTKYALKTDNAPTATKLYAARTIALSGDVSGSVSSDFGSNVTISTTLANFDASKITSGIIDIDRLPKAALERMVVVADDTARFKLTTATAQVGDTVKVTATNKMYLVKDDSKLNTEAGYEPYTASSASANMKAATASAAGAAGLVPAPAAGKQTSFLRGDGTWVVPTNTTYGLASTTANGLLRQLNGSTSSFMRGDGTWATPPNTTYAVANESTNGLMAAADKKTVNRLIGVNTVTTLANLPISKRSITATLSAATALSVASGMQIGEELMIRCVPSAVFTQAIPNSGAYVSMSGTSITTTANKPFEINIWCYASGKYSIAVKEQD